VQKKQKLSRKDAETQRVRKERRVVARTASSIADKIRRKKYDGKRIILLLNFNVPVLKDGIHRIVLGLEE